ncbi:MAG: bifunctional diguanylate cyclase/phosphodiesterase, partial [Nitrosomonadales bacterium]
SPPKFTYKSCTSELNPPQINDTLGHRVGDLLLCEVANRLKICVRESDLVARFGGDEFVMLISDAATVNDVGQLAAKIVESVGQPCKLDGHDIEVRPSLGIALYGRDGQDIETLLKHADAAMYEAKAAGRGTFRFYDETLNRIAVLQSELALHLQRAIVDGELRLHFQPQAALDNFRVTGLEALVRWEHPEHGLIFPDNFLSLAEEDSLLILPLGYWVIDAACHQLATWKAQDVPLVPIYINVSTRQFRDANLVNRIFAALDKYSLPGELLGIEITENCITDDPDQAMAQMMALRARGVQVTIDDFKSGFLNFGLLSELHIRAIMIDRSLIGNIHNHHNDAIIVDSIITLAHKLGFRVLAEGVETREQVLHLKLAGCDEVQGYFFQRPAPANEIESMLHQGEFEK